MADPISALKGHVSPGRSGLDGPIGVTLSEVAPFSLTQVSAWPDSLVSTGKTATRLADCANAPGPGRAATGKSGTLLRVEPLKWWLVSKSAASDQLALPSDEGALLDLSSSRTWLKLKGENAADLLNRFLPINLSPAVFAPGSVASTAFHHVGVTLWRQEDAFNLFLPRSFAASLFEQLTESGAQFGLEVV